MANFQNGEFFLCLALFFLLHPYPSAYPGTFRESYLLLRNRRRSAAVLFAAWTMANWECEMVWLRPNSRADVCVCAVLPLQL